MKKLMKRFLRGDEGATMVEYGLMVALIAVVAMVGAKALGISVNGIFNAVSGAVDGAAPVP